MTDETIKLKLKKLLKDREEGNKDVRDVLSDFDNKNVYDESGTECESFAAGAEIAVEIILNAQRDGRLYDILSKLRAAL